MRLRRPGSGPGVSAPPDAGDSPPVPAGPAGGAAREQQPGGPAVRRRRRRRRLLIAPPFLVLLVWATVSYTTWMLQPTSLSWQVNSVEWVRHNVPFGNWLADTSERIYYTHHVPKKGGPQLKSLPAVALNPPRTSPPKSQAAAWPPPIKPVFPAPAARRRGLEAGRPAG